MSTHKWMDRICVAAAVFSLLLTVFFMNGEALGIQAAGKAIGYENRLFDSSRVHTVDIVMEDWDGFLSTCQSEEYSACGVVIDGESYKNVGIRGKGNTSLSSVATMGSSRYSFKIEFDQYDSTKSYHGLDKLSLNNLIQDNTMMKDYLTYQMMNAFGVSAPLCSFVYITVNGEDWGLYLAVEGVEESFLQRNYGSGYGELYKPDSMSFGGGRGNGRDFTMDHFANSTGGENEDASGQTGQMPDFGDFTPPAMPGGGQENTEEPSSGNFDPSSLSGGGGSSLGSSSDVKLQYIDDDPDSYSNIFDNAKTDISKADKVRLISSLQSLSSCEELESVLDTDEVLRYFVVHNFVVNGDSYTGSMIHNYYLYEENGKLSMIPWDYNLAFGTFTGGAASSAVNEAIDDVLSDRPMQAWIFSDEGYIQQYHTLYSEFLSTVDAERIISDAYALIADYVEKDPTKFCTYEEFEAGVQALSSFCGLRRESARGQLAGTIPSTSGEQNDDPSALVGADDLSLSDMGTMNGSGGPGGFGKTDAGGSPPESMSDSAVPENPANPEGEEASLESGFSPQQEPGTRGEAASPEGRPGQPFGNGEFPGAQGETATGGTNLGTGVFLGISALLLLFGLLFAKLYN